MSKHGPCELRLPTCGPQAVAWWDCPTGRTVRLCKTCLDDCFDAADNDPNSEPTAWGWFVPPAPEPADIASWASDPRNHQAVAAVLRREARVDPTWLREFLRREERIHRVALA